MREGLEAIIHYLSQKYSEAKIVPPTTMYSSERRRYKLNPINEDLFRNYDPMALSEAFSVVAIDGGSAEIFDTAYWGIGYIKLRARKIVFDPDEKTGKTIGVESRDGFVLFLSEDEIDTKEDNIVKRRFYEKGNYLKREETRFVRELIKKGFISRKELVLIDGTLSSQGFYEQELAKLHKRIIGISKRSGMTINKYSAASYLARLARKFGKESLPWYCYPLVAEYPGKEQTIAEILFANFSQGGRCFRVDFPSGVLKTMEQDSKHEYISKQLSKIALFSMEPKYKNYPYPLGAVHSDAVMRPRDREQVQTFIKHVFMNTKMDNDIMELIKKDIEEDMWYERFRRRA